MRARATHSIGQLAADLKTIGQRTPRAMNGVVRDQARDGNRRARAFASEQHTMNSDVDVDYAPSFTVEKLGPSDWVYGPDAALPQGSKASGYEFGSINQASPHQNLDRSLDIVRPAYTKSVDRELGVVWKEGGFA